MEGATPAPCPPWEPLGDEGAEGQREGQRDGCAHKARGMEGPRGGRTEGCSCPWQGRAQRCWVKARPRAAGSRVVPTLQRKMRRGLRLTPRLGRCCSSAQSQLQAWGGSGPRPIAATRPGEHGLVHPHRAQPRCACVQPRFCSRCVNARTAPVCTRVCARLRVYGAVHVCVSLCTPVRVHACTDVCVPPCVPPCPWPCYTHPRTPTHTDVPEHAGGREGCSWPQKAARGRSAPAAGALPAAAGRVLPKAPTEPRLRLPAGAGTR